MKLCIELDEEMQKEWMWAKRIWTQCSGFSKRVIPKSQILLRFNVFFTFI
jgi:hypothetical protein